MRRRDLMWLAILGGGLALVALYRRKIEESPSTWPRYPDREERRSPDMYLASNIVDRINRSLYYG